MPMSKNHPIRVATLEKQRQALELRRAGLGYVEIGVKLGLGKSRAHALVVSGLAEARAQIDTEAQQLKAEELSRLDALLSGLWPLARKGNLGAVDRVIKIGERRAALLGLNAPIRSAVDFSVPDALAKLKGQP